MINLIIGFALLTLIASAFIFVPYLQRQKLLLKKSLYLWGLVGIISICSLGLYSYVGAFKAVSHHTKQQEWNKIFKKFETPDALFQAFKNRVLQEPSRAEGWYLLGKLAISFQKYQEAEHAFEKANQLNPNNAPILTQYALAIFFNQGKTFLGKPEALLSQALQIQPNYPEALNLLALAFYSQKHYGKALNLWEQLLPQLELNSEAEKAVQALMTEAKTHRDSQGNFQIKLQVVLDPSLKKQASPNDRLFVYVKLPHQKMPIIAVQHKVSDLPLKIILTEQQAMLPNLASKLSPGIPLELYARVSRHNGVKPQKGDLVGKLFLKRGEGKQSKRWVLLINRKLD